MMKTVYVHASVKYPVYIGQGILKDAGLFIKEIIPSGRAAVITETTVDALYGNALMESLKTAGIDAVKYVFPAGEASKNIRTYAGVLEFLAEAALTRADYLIALGGGVAGDLAGFAAATYLRGIPFVQIPTSLLAAADASVGGKTAIDLLAGKNLAGAFHQPSCVIIDTDTFSSLPRDVFADGMAETVKHGLIADASFFDYLKDGPGQVTGDGSLSHFLRDNEQLAYIAEKNVTIKSSFVEADEFDRGRRQMLNFGHTIGHAIEKCSDFAMSHGRAVAIGMCAATRAAYGCGLAGDDLSPVIAETLRKYGLDLACPYPAALLTEAALRDKKRTGGTINIIYLKKIGEAAVHTLPVGELEAFFKAGEPWISA